MEKRQQTGKLNDTQMDDVVQKILRDVFCDEEIGRALQDALFEPISKRLALLWCAALMTLGLYVNSAFYTGSLLQVVTVTTLDKLIKRFGGVRLMKDKTIYNFFLKSKELDAESRALLQKFHHSLRKEEKVNLNLNDIRNLKPLFRDIVSLQADELIQCSLVLDKGKQFSTSYIV